MTLAQRIQAAIDRSGGALTQRGLAMACGISAPSVNGWASGKSASMLASHLFPAAAYLGVRPYWLATGRGPMTDSEAHGVSEATPIYTTWPIKAISQQDYLHLPARLRNDIEKHIALVVRDYHAHQEQERQGTA